MADPAGWIESNRGHILVTLINLAALGIAVFWLRRPAPATMEIVAEDPGGTVVEGVATPPSPLRIYVSGAVNRPDVYTVAPGSLVKTALEAAGGAAEGADLDHVNLAVELSDQEQVYVPSIGEFKDPPAQVAAVGRVGGQVSVLPQLVININTATESDLQNLPGIGTSLARRIVEYRLDHGPFVTMEEIMDVPGIGEATYERIKDRLVLR